MAKIPSSHSWSGVRRAGDGQASAAAAAASIAASAPTTPGVSAPNVSSASFVPASSKEPSESPVHSTLPAVAEEKPTSTLSVFVVEKTTVKVSASTLVHEYSASALEE